MIGRVSLLIVSLLGSCVLAQEKPVLTVYTYSSFVSQWGPGPALKAAFEKQCQCQLDFVAVANAGTLLNRLRIEGQHTKADLVLGLDAQHIQKAQASGLFAEHQQPLKTLQIPGGWSHPYFLPMSYGYFSFLYHANRLKKPPKSLQEMVHRQDLRVIYPDPQASTVGQGLLYWMQSVFAEQTRQAWQALSKHTVTVPSNWSAAYSLFLKGESDLVLSYTTSAAYHIHHQDGQQVTPALFSEGHIRQVQLIAKLKHAQNNPLAEQFLRFILQPTAQQYMMLNDWMYPVIDMPLLSSFQKLTRPSVITLDPEYVDKNYSKWIQTWRLANR